MSLCSCLSPVKEMEAGARSLLVEISNFAASGKYYEKSYFNAWKIILV